MGYHVSGVDISENAKKLVENKLQNYPQFKDKVDLRILGPKDESLYWEDNFFDYIVSNQTVYYLFSKQKIVRLLNEFKRILKPQGRLIVTMMSRFNMGCIKGKEVGEDLYEWISYYKSENKPDRVYIVKDENHARDLFSMFKIHEVGYFDNYYCGVAGHHWVILASK